MDAIYPSRNFTIYGFLFRFRNFFRTTQELEYFCSHPYNKIGFTILSNKSNWHLMDKLCILPFLNTSYMALIPLFTSSFFAILNDPVFENTIPR